MMIAGRHAVEKAQAVGKAILARSRRLMREAGFDDFQEASTEILGSEASYGAQSRARGSREVVLKIAVRHQSKEALQIFAREIYPAATAMAQGLTGFAGGRPEPQPVIRLFSFLADKTDVPVAVSIDGKRISVELPLIPLPGPSPRRTGKETANATLLSPSLRKASEGQQTTVPLIALAHGRSGDKGDIANIGVLARRSEFAAVLRQQVTSEAVGNYFAHFAKGKVERFEWPGLNGFNFLLRQALGGGGIASLRHDPQGKAMAQILMDLPVKVPACWLAAGGPLAGWRDTSMPTAAGARA